MDQMTVEQMQDYRDNFGPVSLSSNEGEHHRFKYFKSRDMDVSAPDTIFPDTKYVYCVSHMNPHTVGWCTVRVANKYPLLSTDREKAIAECRDLDFPLFEDVEKMRRQSQKS